MTADPDFDSPTKFESLGYKDVFDSTVDEDDDKENKSDDDDEIIVDKSMQSPRKVSNFCKKEIFLLKHF